MQLPPKRYEYFEDPRFDSIRHNPWFAHLAERRAKLPMLVQALHLHEDGIPQVKAAEAMGVDERELQDFIQFVAGYSRVKNEFANSARNLQGLLDKAYEIYMGVGAHDSFVSAIRTASLFFGINPRMVIELWEVDPTFYPTNYRGIK